MLSSTLASLWSTPLSSRRSMRTSSPYWRNSLAKVHETVKKRKTMQPEGLAMEWIKIIDRGELTRITTDAWNYNRIAVVHISLSCVSYAS